jgi:homoserine dehydrogenase
MGNTQIRIGLLGFGNVGSAFVSLLEGQKSAIAARTGLELCVTHVAVKDLTKQRNNLDLEVELTDEPQQVVTSSEVDIVVELMGGLFPAKDLIEAALANNKPVVTANKELLSKEGKGLFNLADKKRVDLLFEAAVAGGVPLIRVLRESLVGEPIEKIMGIVNGTTNYILSQMDETGAPYDEALLEAQQLGYAENDPTADVNGQDAASKAAIIAMVAFGADVALDDVLFEGIENISSADMAFAKKTGNTIKLLAMVAKQGDDLEVQVYPVMLSKNHPLSSVSDSYNAVFVEGNAVGDLMLFGRGAGGMPTASAVMGDVIDVAINLSKKTHRAMGALEEVSLMQAGDQKSAYYIGVQVIDEPGVLATVASIFGDNDISIQTMEQEGMGREARLIFITHEAEEKQLEETLSRLSELSCVEKLGTIIKVLEA